MRKLPIKFRGRDKSGRWHYGDLIPNDWGTGKDFIREFSEGLQDYHSYEVEPESVAQFAGYDEGGNELYEGDIVIFDGVREWEIYIASGLTTPGADESTLIFVGSKLKEEKS